MPLGVNLCFAVKRMPEPERWAAFVREDLGLDHVQFTFDLLDPWWPEPHRSNLIRRTAAAAQAHDLSIHSAFVGLAHYVPSGLLDPDPDARAVAKTWWWNAVDVAAALGAGAVGGPLGTISDADFAAPASRQQRYDDLLDALSEIGGHASESGLSEVLIEPTPIARELPATIDKCARLLGDLAGRGVTNVGLTLDTGHMTFQPLHGQGAAVDDWIHRLGSRIRQIHLDNSDGNGDPHWGWPDARGSFDVAGLAEQLRGAGLGDISVVLEVYPRFEDDSGHVLDLIRSSIDHCRPHFAPPNRPAAPQEFRDALAG
ncbi:MAG: TIM barrel protein [Actinobacteria bacterium]|nr:TIM barrel protein [Actinomycetota bacterium]MBI3687427.1 TIM barrel protein [Actinomycetota bacterium]